MGDRLTVMISSTVLDLPEHRKEVGDACLRQGMFPSMMEHLPASDAEAMSVSRKLVDEADIYIGVFAYRYGYVPKANNPKQISITEMEYDQAVERKIPRLIFVMGDDHPIKAKDMEIERAAKLKELKERVQVENIVNSFDSASDLRGHVINSLSQQRVPDLTAFHYVSEIPEPPAAFIAHPYTLLQTHRLIGRQAELSLLTDWVTKPESDVYNARMLSCVAIGGMGKSALTWNWFKEIAPREMKPLAGEMWWSFYESDATFENFVTRALAYVTRRPLTEVEKISTSEREAQLHTALHREPFLIVLDGLERLLIDYARIDAARLQDSDVGSQRTRRKTADPRVGRFLRRLTQVKHSRILVNSRLYPADLETDAGDPIVGSFRKNIEGLTDEDAVELWRAFDVTGSRDDLLPIFATFANHPLLIQALAGEVKRYHRAPGDFAAWRKANPRFDPTKFKRLQDAMAHVLEFALLGLADKAHNVLHTIAAFRMPASYDTLAALFLEKVDERSESDTGDEGKREAIQKRFTDEPELDAVLTELEDRGLLGWDKRANRYDLHPIVRGVVWSGLEEDERRGLYANLHIHFEALPMIDDFQKVSRLEDLTTAIELYNTLIGLGRYDDAYRLFNERLDDATLYRLSASRQRVELLEMLFPDGLDQLPHLREPRAQSYVLNSLAQGHQLSGKPGSATQLLRRAGAIDQDMKDYQSLSVDFCNLSTALHKAGSLYEAESASRRALLITREQENRFQEAVSLDYTGLILAARGRSKESVSALRRSLRMFVAQSIVQAEGLVNAHIAQERLWFGEFAEARFFANRAWELAHARNAERDFIRAARVRGEAALGLHDLAVAEERLHHALSRARQVNFAEEELPALVALAELRRQEGKPDEARGLLDDVWDSAERGPYPPFHADAFNVLAQIERDAGNSEKAVEAADKAYRLAWCDGPPFAYHWGLVAARKHLQELGAPEPEMSPFDKSKFEPMPKVEIDPDDEFHAEASPDN